MISDDFFSKLPPKSTGPDYFGSKWLEQCLNSFKKNLSPEDAQCTLAELTALSLSNSLSSLKILIIIYIYAAVELKIVF